jgi:hypothetical protein
VEDMAVVSFATATHGLYVRMMAMEPPSAKPSEIPMNELKRRMTSWSAWHVSNNGRMGELLTRNENGGGHTNQELGTPDIEDPEVSGRISGE